MNNFEEACYSQPNRKGKDSITPSPKCLGPQCSSPPVCSFRADNSLDTTVKPQPIGPVRDLRSSTNLERTVLLSWRPPIAGHDCIKEYLITWGSESETIPASSTFYYVTDLEPCMRYNFTVNTIDQSNEKGTPATVEETVREENQLSEVTELELNEVEPRSLTAKWKAPVNGTYCVGSYRLAAWYDGPQTGEPITVFSNTTDDLHVTFGEVIACMTYTVQVIPISFSNKDGRNDIGTLKTKERTILSYHVEPIRALSVKARSLILSTQLLSENNNNCFLVGVRFSCSKVVDGEVDPESQIVREFLISGNESYEGIVEPLVPFTLYQCTAQIQNIAGWSEPTPAYEFQTAEDVPESPSALMLSGDRESIVVAWKAPTVKNGVVVRYRIHVRMVEPMYPIPKICEPFEEYNETVDLRDEVDPGESRSWDGAEFEYTISRLNPFTLYTVQIAAATGAGVGSYTEPQDVITLPSVPEAVQNFVIEEIEGPELDQAYRSAVKLSWQLPCRLHGNLARFVGRLYGTRGENGSPPHELTWNVEVQADEINDTYLYVEDRLKPEYNYTVSMSVEVADVAEQSPKTTLSFLSPAGIPAIEQTEDLLNVNVLDAPNPTNTARIVLGKINLVSDIGSIQYMALLISERGCQEDPTPKTDLLNTTLTEGNIQWPEILDWHRVTNMRCVEQYQTTPEFWNPMSTASRADDPIEYVVGREQCNDGKKFCNGPLKPGTEYALVVRVISRSAYSDSPFRSFRTASMVPLGLITSLVVGFVLLASTGGLVVLWRRQRSIPNPQLSELKSVDSEPSDIPLKNFPNQYDELFQSNREKVGHEFQAINYFCDTTLVETVTFFKALENERKNRYLNVLPYDFNRVLLNVEGETKDATGDYINASLIDGHRYSREYIATQGPMEGTCYDFWTMIVQYKIETIVMLIDPSDQHKNKCFLYYPTLNRRIEYGDIQLRCTQEINLSFYCKRIFSVSRGNLSNVVSHYHYFDWPAHNCPANLANLIDFIMIVRRERKSYAIPLVVHCSAGVGRTGTFIALDIILQKIQKEKKICVYTTVKNLRRKRVYMVQTLDQYAFLYQCCLEYIHNNGYRGFRSFAINFSFSQLIQSSSNGQN
ncbi:AGAP011650-PA-like protein [Anopheles sinensis]|uniref:protein-tyrosine-phosphatase n=1 Tax=Anopheles sinensis TaxID=74873 RepID=A0A084VIB2_ANOSI|nr:AGAP011650-PA-like protein [Anopheles sinensis]